MIMIVRERRREIGVIKAIGGTNRSVIGQFMTESLTLTFIGGVVGLVLGVAVSGPMTSSLVKNSESSTSTTRQSGMPRGSGGPAERQLRQTIGDITSNASPATFAAAVGIMFLIAVLGSALPAWVVANIKPAEVLRSE
jgi:putative ABC transport system permease protein